MRGQPCRQCGARRHHVAARASSKDGLNHIGRVQLISISVSEAGVIGITSGVTSLRTVIRFMPAMAEQSVSRVARILS